jgi:hypothetical protein
LFARFMLHGKMVRMNRFLGAFRQHSAAKTSQLLATVGTQEIQRVWHKYGIKSRYLDQLRQVIFQTNVTRRGSRHTQLQRILPGCLPGVGWTYDELWGNMLAEGALPPLGDKPATAA